MWFSNGCNLGVCGPIWMIFISKERSESVDFAYWKPILINYRHHGVISRFVKVPFTFFFVFTKVLKYCHFQTVVTWVYVDRSEWSSYQKKGKNLWILKVESRFWLSVAIMPILFRQVSLSERFHLLVCLFVCLYVNTLQATILAEFIPNFFLW